jgi:spore maturation protein CgeB
VSPSGSFTGLRVVLVAAFNRRYHRSGVALGSALHELGCDVRRCEARLRGLNSIFRRPLAARLRGVLTQRRADVVLVFKGTELHPDSIGELKRAFGGRWANWFPDDPHALAVSTALSPAYDAFFTHDSSSVEPHRRAGARAHYLSFGCEPAYHRPLAVAAPWRSAVTFVGSRDPARARVLADVADLGIRTWGPRWPAGPVYGDDFIRALAGASVGLNIHQHFGPAGDPARYGTGANMRLFELAAVGTPQLSDAKADIARHFAPDREIVLYRSVAELREQARALLADDERRRALAAAARTRALREHTWAQRLEELLSVVLR